MPKQTPFIDREEELERIHNLMREWGTRRLLCIHGPGGIGKTRLLQEIQARYQDETSPRLAIAGILDFHDPSWLLSQNVGRQIAHWLDPEAFQPYLYTLIDARKAEMAGVSRGMLGQVMQQVDQDFVQCFNKFSDKKRVVLLVDTIEALWRETGGADLWNRLMGLALSLKNTLLLLAGRKVKKFYKQQHSALGEDIQLMELDPFSPKVGLEYLRMKEKQLNLILDEQMEQKLALLAGGRPLLLDLAVEWLARTIPIPWLVEQSLEELQALPDEEKKRRENQFEQEIVQPIQDLRSPMDRLILTLAHAHPLDVPEVASLLEIPETKARALFNEARTIALIKSLPGDRIVLHDEVARLIETYVLPNVDPDRSRRRFLSQRMSEYLGATVESIQHEIDTLHRESEQAREAGDTAKELESFLQEEEKERTIWGLRQQWAKHLMEASREEGFPRAIQLFDQATDDYRFSVRGAFLEELLQWRDMLSPAQQSELDIRRAKQRLDYADYQGAIDLLDDLLRRDLSAAQRVDVLIQRGNNLIRLGESLLGVDDFEHAVKISRESDLKGWLIRAENALGWGCRLVGRFKDASCHYRDALRLSIELGDRKRQAWILNNLAMVYTYQQSPRVALSFCRQAEALWREMGFGRGLGGIYIVYGEVFIDLEKLDQAEHYFLLARDLFEPQDDKEWLSVTYSGLGTVYWLTGHLDDAIAFLEKGLGIGLRRDRAMLLHRLAHVYQDMGTLQQAQSYFRQSLEESKQVPNRFYWINSLGDLVRIAILQGDYQEGTLSEFEEEYQEFEELKPPPEFPLPEGLLLKYLGDMALGLDRLDRALDYYQRGLPLIAAHEAYEPFTLRSQLEDLRERIADLELPAKTVIALGQHLEQVWEDHKLTDDHPEVIPFFARWKKGAR